MSTSWSFCWRPSEKGEGRRVCRYRDEERARRFEEPYIYGDGVAIERTGRKAKDLRMAHKNAQNRTWMR
jgi:hypothetical protein